MGDVITHTGIIEHINGLCIRVKIVQASVCSACKAHTLCNASDSKEKFVDVYEKHANEYYPGEQVILYGTTGMGLKAVFLGFGLPFVILMLVLFLAMYFTDQNEGLSALIALLALIPYYIALSLCKNKLSREFTFSIGRMNN